MATQTQLRTPVHRRTRNQIEVLESPSKDDVDEMEQVLMRDPDYERTLEVQTLITDHLDAYHQHPMVQLSLLASHHRMLDEFARYRQLNRGVLISPDVPVQLPQQQQPPPPSSSQQAVQDLQDFIDDADAPANPDATTLDADAGVDANPDGPAAGTRSRRMTTSTQNTMYTEERLRSYNLQDGDGTENSPKIVGTIGLQAIKAASLSVMLGWDADKMSDYKMNFVTDVCGTIYHIDYNGSTKWCRMHPETVNLWAEVLYGSLDTSGWKNLRTIFQSASETVHGGETASTALAAQQLATNESIQVFKDFYHFLAQSIQMDVRKDAYWYLLKAWADYNLYKVYRQLQDQMDHDHSVVRQRVDQYELAMHRAVRRGRGTADRVKSYLAEKLGTSVAALTSQINSGKPVKIIVDKVGPGFLMLVSYSQMRKLNKMVVGVAEDLVERFVDHMTPPNYNELRDGPRGVRRITQKIFDRLMSPILAGNITKIQDFPIGNPGDNQTLEDLIDTQLVVPPTTLQQSGQAMDVA